MKFWMVSEPSTKARIARLIYKTEAIQFIHHTDILIGQTVVLLIRYISFGVLGVWKLNKLNKFA